MQLFKRLVENKIFLGAVILFSSAILLILVSVLSKLPLIDWDEAIYADIAKNTIATHNWFTLTRFNQPWFEKPPLYIWLIIASIKIFGNYDLVFRLPSILLTSVCVLLLYFLVYELCGKRLLSLLAALILLFTSPFFTTGIQSRMDIPVTAAILFSVLCFVKGADNKKWLLGSGISIGIGILFKSIIGLTAVIPIFTYILIYRRWNWLKEKNIWIGLGIALLIIAPWHIYETVMFGGQFWNQYLMAQVVERGLTTDFQGMTVSDYLRSLWEFDQPWSFLFLLLTLIVFLLNKKYPVPKIVMFTMLFGFISSVLLFLFFSFARTKMWAYLIPVFPFQAIFIAAGIYYISQNNLLSRLGKTTFSIFIGLILLLGVIGTTTDAYFKIPKWYFPYVSDEKNIGVYLANQNDVLPIYLYKWQPNESIRFYSGKTIQSIKLPPSAINKHFYLIVLSNYVDSLYSDDPSYRSAPKLYEGFYLTLLKT